MSAARCHAFFLLLLCLAVAAAVQFKPASSLECAVTNDTGPLAGASVGWLGQPERATTDALGRFWLPLSSKSNRIIATKPGYRIASAWPNGPISLHLKPLPTHDNDEYAWIDPHPDPTSPNNCGNCHGEIYREWRMSAHANSATNPKFLALFAPEAKTWNARREHPDGSAVCAKCHAPTLDSPTLEYDVREAAGVAKSGIHCDYCHKVADAPPGKFGTRFGRDALELLRPAPGDTLTFGPLDDAVRNSPLASVLRGEGPGVRGSASRAKDAPPGNGSSEAPSPPTPLPRIQGRGKSDGESFAFAPVFKDSRYCASCHEGIIFGVHAYGTYSEWLDSLAKKQGKQCQDCHMTPTGKMTNIAPGKGGLERHPKTLASHHMPGGTLEMLRQSLKLDLKTSGAGQLAVTITAERVGHRVPTGFADRQLVLVAEALDGNGKGVDLVEGPRLPKSAGKWSGMPGVLYAKQLIGEKERTPTPFWLPILKSDDTRLQPEQPDRRAFVFADDAKRVTVQLWYRRFWQEVADARGWADNEVLVAERVLTWDK